MAVREAEPVASLSEVREAGLDREDLLAMFRNMLITRGIEERGHILYKQGKIPGSFYTGRGNEASSVGVATATLALGPLITLGLAAAIGLERVRAIAVVGALIAFIGIAVMYASAVTGSVPISSLLLLLAAAFAFAIGGIVAKRTPPMDPTVQNGIATSIGAAVLIGLAIAAGEDLAIPQRFETWLAFVYLVIAGTLLTFAILLYLLRRWPASRVAYQFVLSPLVAILIAAVLLGEPIEPAVIAGTALVVVGVWLGALRSTTPG